MSLLKNLRKFIRIKKHYNLRFFRHISILKKFKNEISKKKSKISKNYLYRLQKEYLEREKKHQYNKNSTDVWDPIFNNFQKNLQFTLRNTNEKNIIRILDNPGQTNLFLGFETNVSSKMWANVKENLFAIDRLISFSEFLGIENIYNPERDKISVSKINIDNLINQIENKIGIKLIFKNPFPGERGIKTSRGILNEKEIQAMYTAYKISLIIKKGENVLEIGGGLGRTAYYCNLFGIKDYSIVDIPLTFLAQGNYLGRVLNPKKIKFENELSKKYVKKSIKLITPEYFLRNKKNYDLILNCDSLTEININLAQKYMRKISKAKYFLSINHEKNSFKISTLIKKFKFIEYLRNLYWLRKRYVEQIIKFKK
jgi:hypothetical protein